MTSTLKTEIVMLLLLLAVVGVGVGSVAGDVGVGGGQEMVLRKDCRAWQTQIVESCSRFRVDGFGSYIFVFVLAVGSEQ